MAAIWEYPDLEELEQFIIGELEEARQEIIEEGNREAENVFIDQIFIVDEWGNGTAEIGSDPLNAMVFFGYEDVERPTFDPLGEIEDFEGTVNDIAQRTVVDLDPPEPAPEYFTAILITPKSAGRTDTVINRELGRSERNSVFDLTNKEAVFFAEPEEPSETDVFEQVSQPVSFEELPRFGVEELLGPEEEEEPEEPPEEPEEPEEEEEEEIEFPEVEEPLRRFAVSEDELEIPAGKHEKKIEARDPYDFEVEMAGPGEEVPEISENVIQEIGESIAGRDFGNDDPPGTFPRTGIYIRNRLTFEGIAYIYQLYKDLVYYSGYITGLYQDKVNTGFRAGKYPAFREYIYVLKRISESDDGPVLIELVSQQRTASLGLETIPDHPTIEGEKAPWLSNRQYIDVVDEDSEVWFNPYGFLYKEEEEEEEAAAETS